MFIHLRVESVPILEVPSLIPEKLLLSIRLLHLFLLLVRGNAYRSETRRIFLRGCDLEADKEFVRLCLLSEPFDDRLDFLLAGFDFLSDVDPLPRLGYRPVNVLLKGVED